MDIEILDGVTDAALLLSQVAEHLSSSLESLSEFTAKVSQNPWTGKTKVQMLRVLYQTVPYHKAVSETGQAVLDAVVQMLADHDAAMASVADFSGLKSAY